MTELDLWLGDRRVATVTERDRGRKVAIRYDESVSAQVGNEVALLSCSLPTPGPSSPGAARAFLEGLLPEGQALEQMAASVRTVRVQEGAPAEPGDVVALLAEYGRECAGAVSCAPSGEDVIHAGDYHPLDDRSLAGLIRNLPTHPLGVDPSRNIRMSLAGAQPKLLLARLGDDWYQPSGGAASTHILKPTDRWPDSARNEALVMALARACALTPSASWLEDIDGRQVLVVERYDRVVVGDRVERLHQEDLCQALAEGPRDKYHLGRPSERAARLLRRFADDPILAIETLFRQIAFRALVGDEDGHGKNYSLLLTEGSVSLAPLYDSLCTLAYPDLSGRMGMPIATASSLMQVDRHALLDEARAMGIPAPAAAHGLDRLVEQLRAGIAELPPPVVSGWASDRVVGTITARLDRLEAGERLGDATGRSSSRRRPRQAATMSAQTVGDRGPQLS
ncbi:MAG TPA: HipA domain-containing protein [Actinomycetota bacterium]|nr:HipA domain-containing protein [Actinomycetota bacterium]